MFAACGPAAAAARRLRVRRPRRVALLRGSAAGGAAEEDRRPAGGEQEARGGAGRAAERRAGSPEEEAPEDSPEQRPTRGRAPRRAGAGGREATPVGREAEAEATGASTLSSQAELVLFVLIRVKNVFTVCESVNVCGDVLKTNQKIWLREVME